MAIKKLKYVKPDEYFIADGRVHRRVLNGVNPLRMSSIAFGATVKDVVNPSRMEEIVYTASFEEIEDLIKKHIMDQSVVIDYNTLVGWIEESKDEGHPARIHVQVLGWTFVYSVDDDKNIVQTVYDEGVFYEEAVHVVREVKIKRESKLHTELSKLYIADCKG